MHSFSWLSGHLICMEFGFHQCLFSSFGEIALGLPDETKFCLHSKSMRACGNGTSGYPLLKTSRVISRLLKTLSNAQLSVTTTCEKSNCPYSAWKNLLWATNMVASLSHRRIWYYTLGWKTLDVWGGEWWHLLARTYRRLDRLRDSWSASKWRSCSCWSCPCFFCTELQREDWGLGLLHPEVHHEQIWLSGAGQEEIPSQEVHEAAGGERGYQTGLACRVSNLDTFSHSSLVTSQQLKG